MKNAKTSIIAHTYTGSHADTLEHIGHCTHSLLKPNEEWRQRETKRKHLFKSIKSGRPLNSNHVKNFAYNFIVKQMVRIYMSKSKK